MSKYAHSPASAAMGIEHAIRMLEGRWKLVILFHLFGGKTLRFSDLERAIPDVSQKMLSQQLRQLNGTASSRERCTRSPTEGRVSPHRLGAIALPGARPAPDLGRAATVLARGQGGRRKSVMTRSNNQSPS